MKQPRKRTFEFVYRDIADGGAYFYVALADAEQRARVRRVVGLKRNEILLSIRHFWIDPRLRGTGLGKRMINQVTGALDALGHPCALYALPYDKNPLGLPGLVKFYERAGFKQIGSVKSGNWKGCPLMVRGVL
jgi:GNAT superfamily N-acetyltransferase